MDHTRFDAVAKALISRVSSRRVLMRGTLVGTVGTLEFIESDAKKKRKKCKRGTKRCGKRCVNLATDANNCGGCGNRCLGSRPDCIQGFCGASVCPANALFCGTPQQFFTCKPGCGCASKVTTSEGFCADSVSCAQTDCQSDDDCVARGFPAGSACVDASGPNCDCAKGCATVCPA